MSDTYSSKAYDYDKGKQDPDDCKRWFNVTVSESYSDSFLVRALDEEDAQNMVDHLLDTGTISTSSHGEYERTVDPYRYGPGREPNNGEMYWEAD